jgi:hypothetical protein
MCAYPDRSLTTGGHKPGWMSNQVKKFSLGFEKLPARPDGRTAATQYKRQNVKFLHTQTSTENKVASKRINVA